MTWTEIEKATGQLASTLAAIHSGLDESEESSPLAAPRQEMLKEVFVFGCQALGAGREDRERWVEWLRVLFREIDGASETQLRGTVYAVELSHNGPPEDQTVDATSYAIVLRRVREARIQQLLSPETIPPPQGGDDTSDLDRPTEEPVPPGGPPAAPESVSDAEDAAEAAAATPAPPPGPLPMPPEPDVGSDRASASRSANASAGTCATPSIYTPATLGSRSSTSGSSAISGPARHS